jgi:hypothetical protein
MSIVVSGLEEKRASRAGPFFYASAGGLGPAEAVIPASSVGVEKMRQNKNSELLSDSSESESSSRRLAGLSILPHLP